MQALLGACLLWALFSTGASLTCNKCVNLMGLCRDSKPQNCAAGEDVCYDLLATITMLGKFNVNLKGCVSSKYCQSGNYSTTAKDDKGLQTTAICCNTDLCNNANFSLPATKNMTSNGFKCPACFSLMADDCQSQEMIPCTGEETQCLSAAGSVNIRQGILPLKMNGAFKGCATTNICSVPEPHVDVGITYNLTRRECTNATSAATTVTNGTLPNSTLSYSRLPLPGR